MVGNTRKSQESTGKTLEQGYSGRGHLHETADWLQAEAAGSQLLTSGPVALHVKEEVGVWKAFVVS